jgi:hypothetical protein
MRRSMIARVLPNGWVDLLRQILLFCGAYWLYRLVRGLVDDPDVDVAVLPLDGGTVLARFGGPGQ